MSRAAIQHDVAMAVHNLTSAVEHVTQKFSENPELVACEQDDIAAAVFNLSAILKLLARKVA